LPDGNGFPFQLTASKISPLSAALIMAEDLVYSHLDDEKLDLLEYIKGRKEFYSRDPFKQLYPKFLEMLL
jgi:hypothetical protein